MEICTGGSRHRKARSFLGCRCRLTTAPVAGITQASAVQPAGQATYSPLSVLTAGSARVAQFKLSIFDPWEDNCKHHRGILERTSRISTVPKCFLVDVQDPTWYCHAELRQNAKNAVLYSAAKTKFKEGAVFIFKNIAFVKDVNS